MHIHAVRRRSLLVLLLVLLGGLIPGLLPLPQARALVAGQAASLVLDQTNFTSGVMQGMAAPSSVALDPTTGKVFVADTGNNRVLRFASRVSLSKGTPPEAVLGQPDFVSNILGVSASQMYEPTGVAVDRSGRLWVADRSANRVLRFDNASSLPSGATADGVLGQNNFGSGTAGTTAQGLNQPVSVAVDALGRLWVADMFNNRVLRFDNAANKSLGAAADGVLGQSDFTSATHMTTAQGMYYPQGVALDTGGHLWVADTLNRRVLRFTNAASKAAGAAADGVLGQPNFTSNNSATTSQGMYDPRGVAVDGDGRLWVADSTNNRVLWFDNATSKGNGTAANGVLGQPNFSSRDGATTAQGMNTPTAVMVDATGGLWVADTANNRVLVFEDTPPSPTAPSSEGQLASLVLGQLNFTSNVANPYAYTMGGPGAVAVDGATGKVFVADAGNNRVLRFASRASLSNGAPAEAVLGQLGFGTNPKGVSAYQMSGPTGVAVDAAGRLWIADKFNNRVLRFDNASNLPSGASADGVLGQPNFTGSFSSYLAQGMWYPQGVAADESGRVWVVDTYNHRVLRFDNAAGKPSGAAADGVLGQANFGSWAYHATTAQGMYYPQGAAVDGSGHLWVADTLNRRVLRFDNAASLPNGAAADGVLGQPSFTTNTRATTAQGMYDPRGVAADESGQLWVSDGSNNRVLRFANAAGKTNGAAAEEVLGQPDFTSNNPATTARGMRNPSGVAVDASGQLWVADHDNNRVLLFGDAPPPTDTPTPTSTLTSTPTPTTTPTSTPTPTGSPTNTPTSTPTGSPTNTPTSTPTGSPTSTPTSTPTGSPTNTPTSTPTPTGTPALSTVLRIPDQRGSPGQIVRVPVLVEQPVSGLLSASLAVTFDSQVLRPHGAVAHPGALAPDWVVAANADTPGQSRLALISSGPPASGTGILVELEFEVVGSVGSSSPLQLSLVSLNDGAIAATTQGGSFTVEAASYGLTVRAVNATTLDPLPNTSVQASGPTSASCLTGANGTCTLANLPAGSYALALSKSDSVAGITAYDASLILQHDVGKRTLAGPAFTAGDTNGSGLVTSFDAALVLQYVAGLRSLPFPAGKVWAFAPPGPVSLSQNQQVTVAGVLVGDVSGHLPPGAQGLRTRGSGPVGTLQLVQRGKPDAQGYRTVELWLSPGGEPLLSLEATLLVDPALVNDLQITAGPSTDVLLASQITPEGQVRVALAGADPIPSGTVVTLRYRSSGLDGLTLARAETNEGGAPVWQPPSVQDWRLHLPLARR